MAEKQKAKEGQAEAGKSPALKYVLRGHKGLVYRVGISPDGKLAASGSDDKTIRVWNLQTGLEQAILTGHTEITFAGAAISDHSLAVSGANDDTVRAWD